MYIKIPAEAALKIPSTASAVELLPSIFADKAMPTATPIGVVREKKTAITTMDMSLNLACFEYFVALEFKDRSCHEVAMPNIYLRNAATKANALKELMEAQCSDKRLYCR